MNGHRHELERISYQGSPEAGVKKRAFKILGHPFGGSCGEVHRPHSPVVCPECVVELGFIDAFFDLRVAAACPEHRTLAVRSCPRCKAPLDWTRRGLLTCRCGGDLSDGQRAPAPAVLVQLLAVIKAKLHGNSIEGVAPEAGFPLEFLGPVKLFNVLRLLPRLGRTRLELIGESSPTEDKVYEAAGHVLGNWPENFRELLRHFGEREVARGKRSPGAFKQFYRFLGPVLRLLENDPTHDWMRLEFIEFARNTWGGLYERNSDRGMQSRFVSMSSYARMTGVTSETVRRLVREGVLTGKIFRAGKNEMTVVDTYASASATLKHNRVSRVAVRRELGLPLPVLDALRKAGIFGVKKRNGLTEWSKRFWFIEDVETFKQRLLACRRDQEPGEEVISFRRAMRENRLSRKAKVAIITALLDRQIQAVGPAGAGLEGLFLLREQVAEVARLRKYGKTPSHSMTETGELIGLRREIVIEAIKVGLLVEISVGCGRRVTTESVDRFRKERLVIGRLARKLRTGRTELGQICQGLGIEIISLSTGSGEGAQVVIPKAREQDLVSALRMRQQVEWHVGEAKAEREQRYVRALCRYVDELKRSGRFLPRRNGAVSLHQVAKGCEFNYNAWIKYPRLKELLHSADLEECRARGLEGRGPAAFLRRYLRKLAEGDEPVPMRSKGMPAPNLSEIARLAGITRDALCRSPALRELVQEYWKTWEARHSDRLRVAPSRNAAAFQHTDSV